MPSTLTKTIGGYEVTIMEDEERGFFEYVEGDSDTVECCGGLWFQWRANEHRHLPDRLELTDYDGTYFLPYEVYIALSEMDVILQEVFRHYEKVGDRIKLRKDS